MEFNSISRVVYDYSKYVEAQEKNGEEAVSFFKYAFGNMNILKDENEPFYRIRGAWLIRGLEIQPMLDENPDAAYYKWTKVDITKEEDKKALADLWCASDKIDGYEINSNEVFK